MPIIEPYREAPAPPAPSSLQVLGRGWRRVCPCCGENALFRAYLKVFPQCPRCGLELERYPTDDVAPYFTILAVGHLVVPLVLLTEQHLAPPEWVHMALWPALATGLTLWLLPRIKGAIIGWQWARGIRR